MYLLEAFRRLTESNSRAELHLVGDGDMMPAARQFVDAAGLATRVFLHGAMTNTAVREMMVVSDVFVQHSVVDPASGDEEGLPVAIVEAMAEGLPVVATRHAGIPETASDLAALPTTTG